jgi:hypothetical protein
MTEVFLTTECAEIDRVFSLRSLFISVVKYFFTAKSAKFKGSHTNFIIFSYLICIPRANGDAWIPAFAGMRVFYAFLCKKEVLTPRSHERHDKVKSRGFRGGLGVSKLFLTTNAQDF